jgi:hypothetical protein
MAYLSLLAIAGGIAAFRRAQKSSDRCIHWFTGGGAVLLFIGLVMCASIETRVIGLATVFGTLSIGVGLFAGIGDNPYKRLTPERCRKA